MLFLRVALLAAVIVSVAVPQTEAQIFLDAFTNDVSYGGPAYYPGTYHTPLPSDYGYYGYEAAGSYGSSPSPSSYYTSPPVAPTYPSSPSPSPSPYYYYATTPVGPTYSSPSPAPYYYYAAPPIGPTYSSPSPAPYYYYATTPVAPTYSSPSPAPYYYYAATPIGPTYSPPSPAPYYYYATTPVGPTYSSPSPAPYYYYATTPGVPTYPSSPSPSPYYYYYYYTSPPIAPTYPSASPAPYYYASPAIAPTYTSPPPYHYSSPTPPTYPATATIPTPAPSTTCYCPFDTDWNSWAIADPSCRSALYAKCTTDSRLPCTWLDQYYAYNPSASSTSTRPKEAAISAYLFTDCPPAPPCACAPLTTSASPSASETYACCRQLQTYATIPHSGLSRTTVDAYCGVGKAVAATKSWVANALTNATCTPSSQTSPLFTFAPSTTSSPVMSKAAAASAVTAVPATSSQAVAPQSGKQRGHASTALIAAGSVVGVAMLTIAAGAVVLYLRRPREGEYIQMV